MPSIRVYATQEVERHLTPKQVEFISTLLRKRTAEILSYDPNHIEVIWTSTISTLNTGPLNIEVMYSVKPDFNPDEALRTTLAKGLAQEIAWIGFLPKEVFEVTAWVLPQHDAVFEVVTRK